MEPGLFDSWARRLAERRSRRNTLGMAAAGAVTLLGIDAARAQDDETGLGDDGFCRLQFEGNVRFGPSFDDEEPFTISGLLAFKIGEGGGLTEGTLTTDDATYPMVGQASGKSIAMRFKIDEDQTFIAVGAGENSVRSCSGEYGGPASGPIRGDLGEWIAFAGESSSTATTAAGATTTAAGPTPTPGPCDSSTCDARMDRNVDAQGNCVCTCPENAVPCGAGCCYGGGTCADPATGTCACSETNDVLCGDTCINRYDCPYNTQFNETTCECTPECYYPGLSGVCCNGSCIDFNSDSRHCGGCNLACESGAICINGECDCPLSCPDGCHDPASDPMNCGGCGYVCSSISSCSGGVCVCHAGYTDCGGTCVDLLSNSVTCGSCNTPCRFDMICVNGACQCVNNLTDCGVSCVDLQYDENNCGACGNVCPDLGPNSGCIFGICV